MFKPQWCQILLYILDRIITTKDWWLPIGPTGPGSPRSPIPGSPFSPLPPFSPGRFKKIIKINIFNKCLKDYSQICGIRINEDTCKGLCPTFGAHGSPRSLSSTHSGHTGLTRWARPSRTAVFTRRSWRSWAARCTLHMSWLDLSHEVSHLGWSWTKEDKQEVS